MLFVPLDFSALYMREIWALVRPALYSRAGVPFISATQWGAEVNYMDYGVQLGRRFSRP